MSATRIRPSVYATEVRFSIASNAWQSGQSWPDNIMPVGLGSVANCYLAEITTDLSGNPISSAEGDEFALIDYKQGDCPADLYIYVGANKIYAASAGEFTKNISVRGYLLRQVGADMVRPTRLPAMIHAESDYFNSGETFAIGTNRWFIGFEGNNGNGGSFTVVLPKKPRSGMTTSHNLTTSLIRCNGNDASSPSITGIGGGGNILVVSFSHTANSSFAKMPCAVQLSGTITYT